ncbi:MAG: DUF2970 domain-containing protein [Gammaproteobacteria bacterium]|nr:DUF2970 domain-containing protein [Gammaproteobacteria bacterium]MBQ0838787.1 DUF2970 domain-containing protein [Gammaproteobacteria bacterium]
MSKQAEDEKLAAEEQKPGATALLKSTLSAAIGVQSNANRERDFKHGNIKTFVVAGIIFTVIFIGSVITVVNLVLP